MSVECWLELQEIQTLRALYRENLESSEALAVHRRDRGPESTAVDPMIQSAMILDLHYEEIILYEDAREIGRYIFKGS